MTDDATLTQTQPPVIDPRALPVTYVDWFLPSGAYEGVVNLSLGVIDPSVGDSTPPPVIVVAKLRMSLDFASRMHDLLGSILKQHHPEWAESDERSDEK